MSKLSRCRGAFQQLTVRELRRVATFRRITGRSRLDRAGLLAVLTRDAAHRTVRRWLIRSLQARLCTRRALRRIQRAYRRYLSTKASNQADPILLEQLSTCESIFKFICENRVVVGYDAQTLWQYMMQSRTFRDPLTQTPYTMTHLRRLDRMVGNMDRGLCTLMAEESCLTSDQRDMQEFVSLVGEGLCDIMHDYVQWARHHQLIECVGYVQRVHIDSINGLLACLFEMRFAQATVNATVAEWLRVEVSTMVQGCIRYLRDNSSGCEQGAVQFMEFILAGIVHSHEYGEDYQGMIQQGEEGRDITAVLTRN